MYQMLAILLLLFSSFTHAMTAKSEESHDQILFLLKNGHAFYPASIFKGSPVISAYLQQPPASRSSFKLEEVTRLGIVYFTQFLKTEQYKEITQYLLKNIDNDSLIEGVNLSRDLQVEWLREILFSEYLNRLPSIKIISFKNQ